MRKDLWERFYEKDFMKIYYENEEVLTSESEHPQSGSPNDLFVITHFLTTE